jgi:hypothetical protein
MGVVFPTPSSIMDILYRKKVIDVISNHLDLEKFIMKNNLYKFFKKFPVDLIDDVNSEILKTKSINFKLLKPWLKNILKYPETIYDERFLLVMGWEQNDVKNFISDKQKTNSNILSEKKKNSPEKYYDKTPKRIEYWMSKGFDYELAKVMVSESQKTFSKQKCIEKYGFENGIKRFNSRQNKWITTLKSKKDYSEINKRKNSFDFTSKTAIELIERSTFLNERKDIILKLIENESVVKFVDSIIQHIEIKSLSDILPFVNSKIIQFKYNVDRNYILDLFYKKCNMLFNRTLYGFPVYHNGIRFKSIKEYKLSLLFETHNMEYVYEKKYDGSYFICDFYLPSLNLYIEYYGMLDGKNLEKLDENQKKYYNKMLEKNEFCDKQKINLICDTNFNNLYNKIKEIL